MSHCRVDVFELYLPIAKNLVWLVLVDSFVILTSPNL